MQSGNEDLERFVDRALRELPPPRAPRTLLPRVMGAIEAAPRRAWYSRSWFAWPRWVQAASLAVAALFAFGLWRLPMALPAPPPAVAAAFRTARVFRDVMQPLLPYLVAVLVLMGAACVVFGAALNYVLLEKVEQRR